MYRGTRRRTLRPALLVVLAIIVPQLLVAGFLAAGIGVLPGRDRSTVANADASEHNLTVGDCVRREPRAPAAEKTVAETDHTVQDSHEALDDATSRADSDSMYIAVDCTESYAYGKVLAVEDGDATATEACPEDTDFFAIQTAHEADNSSRPADSDTGESQVACLRGLTKDRPGKPGRGGGVYRAGDCVTHATGPDPGVREVPCGDPEVFEVVVQRAKKVAECGAPAYRFATLEHGAARILCLGDGPGIASPGQCMSDPSRSPITFAAVDCTSAEAGATVLERVPTAAACRNVPHQTHYVEDPSGLPASRVVCLGVNDL